MDASLVFLSFRIWTTPGVPEEADCRCCTFLCVHFFVVCTFFFIVSCILFLILVMFSISTYLIYLLLTYYVRIFTVIGKF